MGSRFGNMLEVVCKKNETIWAEAKDTSAWVGLAIFSGPYGPQAGWADRLWPGRECGLWKKL